MFASVSSHDSTFLSIFNSFQEEKIYFRHVTLLFCLYPDQRQYLVLFSVCFFFLIKIISSEFTWYISSPYSVINTHIYSWPLKIPSFLIGLVRFYSISTIVGYLMLNPVYTYIYVIFNKFCKYKSELSFKYKWFQILLYCRKSWQS